MLLTDESVFSCLIWNALFSCSIWKIWVLSLVLSLISVLGKITFSLVLNLLLCKRKECEMWWFGLLPNLTLLLTPNSTPTSRPCTPWIFNSCRDRFTQHTGPMVCYHCCASIIFFQYLLIHEIRMLKFSKLKPHINSCVDHHNEIEGNKRVLISIS